LAVAGQKCEGLREIPKSFLMYPQGDSNDTSKTAGNQAFPVQGGTDSGTPKDFNTVEVLAAAVLSLSSADRARLAAMLLAQQPRKGERDAGSV
jgi:hypothetical protein